MYACATRISVAAFFHQTIEKMRLLVTGGAGYIGSNFARRALAEGVEVVVFDNLSRGHREAIPEKATFFEGDLLDKPSIERCFAENSIDAVVHFAAFAYVGESVENPALYYENNVVGSFNLIDAARRADIRRFVFSSTCSIYGNPERVPISEDEPDKPINPYAQTKLAIEHMLRDYSAAYGMRHAALRYFNAAGAAFDGETGESHDPEPHLVPITLNTAMGKRDKIFIFGDDYPTPDGTCVRDFIHVDDLADAHLLALKYLEDGGESTVINLGTGDGNSVKEIIQRAEKITGKKIPTETAPRREGDPARLVADNAKAKKILGWKPKHDADAVLESAWRWHQNQRY